MSALDVAAAQAAATGIDDCWNRIGVHGDGSCPRLAEHIHCRNCPVHAAAALQILDRERPAESLEQARELSARMAAAKMQREQDRGRPAFLFRVGAEWLAVPTTMLDEVADLRRIHSLPHRRSGVVLGLANVRGELLVCVSLGAQLGIDPADQAPAMRGPRLAHKRLLVLRRQGQRLACPVDEVHGNERFEEREHRPVPATVARASASYTRAVLTWREQVVGLLDEELLFNALHRSLA